MESAVVDDDLQDGEVQLIDFTKPKRVHVVEKNPTHSRSVLQRMLCATIVVNGATTSHSAFQGTSLRLDLFPEQRTAL